MTAAFDRIAPSYDETWTHSPVGQLQRSAFWRVAGPLFKNGDTLLDLGCGTGEDAALLRARGIHTIAIDSSRAMVDQARLRGVDARVLRIEDIGRIEHRVDGAFSNFGALNCVERLCDLRERLAALIRPGGFFVACVLGRFCLHETLWYLRGAEFRKASRRWSGSSDSSLELTVYYPLVSEIRDALAPEFKLHARAGIGICVPPSYVRELSVRALDRLDRLDSHIARWPGFRALGDHRVLIFRRP